MTIQKLAEDLCHRDIGRTIAATDRETRRTATGALHSMTLIDEGMSITLEAADDWHDVDLLPSDVVEVTGTAPPIGPDCLHGKHRACDARALNPATDDIVACTCHCHTQEETP